MRISPILVLLAFSGLMLDCSTETEMPDISPDPTSQLPFDNVSSEYLVSSDLDNNSMDGQTVDIDGDDDVDLIIAVEFGRNIILINDGTGRLVDESAGRFPQASHDSEDIAIADFDDDGDIDVVFVSEDDQVNEYYENLGNEIFQASNDRIPVRGTSNAVETIDLNGDGSIDLLIGNRGPNYALINVGGSFIDESSLRLPSNHFTTQDLQLGDLDGDGDLDIVEGNETFNRILINDGSGHFSHQPDRLPQVDDQTRDVELGDVNGDNHLDIFFSNVDFGGVGNPQNRLLLNDGTGIFSEVTANNIPQSQFRTVDSDFIDIDLDGDFDLLTGNRFDGNVMLLLINDGTGSFSDQSALFLPGMNIYPFDFQVEDFNGDGSEDIYICAFMGRDVLLFSSKR